MTPLARLLAAVEAERCCAIPTPHHAAKYAPDKPTARIMGYVEGYVVLRHKGAIPFVMAKTEVIAALRALVAMEGAS